MVAKVVVGRVIVCPVRTVVVRCLRPPRGSEPREGEPQDSESGALPQEMVRVRGRHRHAPAGRRRQTRPEWPDVQVLGQHCRVRQHHVVHVRLAVVAVVVLLLAAVQLEDLVVDAHVVVLLQLLELGWLRCWVAACVSRGSGRVRQLKVCVVGHVVVRRPGTPDRGTRR